MPDNETQTKEQVTTPAADPKAAPAPPAAPAAQPASFPDLAPDASPAPAGGIDLLMDVDLEVKIELGRTQMTIDDILRLKKGAVVELDKLAGDPVDILVNERLVARGEILVVNDNFCVRVTEIVDPEAGLKAEETNG